MKICTKCKENMDLNLFPLRDGAKDGHRNQCISCTKLQKAENHLKNREKRNLYSKNAYYADRKNRLVRQKVLNLKNRQENPDYGKLYYKRNRERILAQKSQYIQVNMDKIVAKNMKRYVLKRQRLPKWLTKEDFNKIQAFYTEAHRLTKETGIKYTVDHIVPLQGENVSGLHVPWNLQILTLAENSSKGNRIKSTI